MTNTQKISISEFIEQVRIRTNVHNTNVTLDMNDFKFGYLKYLELNLGFVNPSGYDDTNDLNESFQLILDRKAKEFTRIRKY